MIRRKKTGWDYVSQHIRVLAKSVWRLFFPRCWREETLAIGNSPMEEREKRIKEEYRKGARYWTGNGWSFDKKKQKIKQVKKRGGAA